MSDYASQYTDKQIASLEKRINSIYKQAQKDIKHKLDDFNKRYKAKETAYLRDLKDGKITQEAFDAWKRGQVFQSEQWKAKREQIANTLVNSNKTAVGIINGHTADVFGKNATYMNYLMEHGAGVNFGFGIYDSQTVARLLANNPQMLPKWKIDQPKDYIWNVKKVNTAVTQGIIQGERLDQITNRISQGLVMQNQNLSKTFARTAMTGAQNAGRLQSLSDAESMGIQVYKQWMATLDTHTRDSHAEIDGESVPVDDKFSNGLEFPGDPGGDPSEVYNCRCTMVGDVKNYPSEYQRYDNIDGVPIRSMSYQEWEEVKTAELDTGVKTKLPTPLQFKHDFDTAKATLPKGTEWRVDDTYTVQDYEHKKLFELSGGSVVAVTDEGDIVSVCKNLEGQDRGSDLLKVAVANGGDRLDAFGDGLYKFYTKNGFEPVSWTPFNEEYAPHDWVKGRDNPEPVIFYRYTGRVTDVSYSEFLTSITPCIGEDGYTDAMAIRNNLIDSNK